MALKSTGRPLFPNIAAVAAIVCWIALIARSSGVCETQPNTKGSKSHGPELQAVKSSRDISRSETLIEPGRSIGLLSLGDSKTRTLEIFPFKADQDQEWKDDCGMTINWVDLPNNGAHGGGNVFVKFRKEKVFQIESATTRFHTRDGVTIYDDPEKVHTYYKDLRAYVLRGAPLRALGDRPLVFWVSKNSGIAFAFAFDQKQVRRYLYKIVIFEPNTEPCPEDQTTDSPNWVEIPPYSLELPHRIARSSPKAGGPLLNAKYCELVALNIRLR